LAKLGENRHFTTGATLWVDIAFDFAVFSLFSRFLHFAEKDVSLFVRHYFLWIGVFEPLKAF